MKIAGLIAAILTLLPVEAWACRIAPSVNVKPAQIAVVEGCTAAHFEDCKSVKQIWAAWYDGPTDRYPHGVLGDDIEYQALSVYSNSQGRNSCGAKTLTLDAAHVFEDLTPRLVDVDLDGSLEVITVRSHETLGAQIAIWKDVPGQQTLQLLATTPYIGTRFRWLAPVGAGDLTGDGRIEIAYVDRPHLAKTLRVVSFRKGKLRPVVSVKGLTNHKIGQDFISGGLRRCGAMAVPEMITADAGWSRVMGTRFVDGTWVSRSLGKFSGRDSIEAALRC